MAGRVECGSARAPCCCDAWCAWQVPEYGGKQLGTGSYELIPSDDEDKPRAGGPTKGGNYNLAGGLPEPQGGGDRQRLQVELAARLLAKAGAKQRRKEEKKAKKKAHKREKKEKKKRKKEEKKKKRKAEGGSEKKAKKEKKHKDEKKAKRARHD